MTDTILETQSLLDRLKSSMPSQNKPPYADVAKSLMQGGTELVHTPPDTTDNTDATGDTDIPFELWETLAYDLALANTDPQTIAQAYDLTLTQLEHVQSNPYFAKILQAKKDEVLQLGSDATFAVKMRMVANRATPQLLKRLTDPNTANRDFLAMFKTVTELGQLIPEPNQDNQQSTVLGASITFNISGVPGLEHLTQTSEPKAVTHDVTDADWEEVVTHQTNKIYDDELREL